MNKDALAKYEVAMFNLLLEQYKRQKQADRLLARILHECDPGCVGDPNEYVKVECEQCTLGKRSHACMKREDLLKEPNIVCSGCKSYNSIYEVRG